MRWAEYIQPEGKWGLASTTSWQPVFKQMFSCRKRHCGGGLGPSTMCSQGCSDNCTGLIKLPEWPHFKALQRPDKNRTALPGALKGKGKGGKRTFRKRGLLSLGCAAAPVGSGRSGAELLLSLSLSLERWMGQMCKADRHRQALEPQSSVQSKLPLQIPHSPATLTPFSYSTHTALPIHSRIPGHGKTHQHKAGGTYVANNLISLLPWSPTLQTRQKLAQSNWFPTEKGTITNLAPPSYVNHPTLLQQVLQHENTLYTPACHFPGCTACTLCCTTATASVRLWCSTHTELQRHWKIITSLVMNETRALWS